MNGLNLGTNAKRTYSMRNCIQCQNRGKGSLRIFLVTHPHGCCATPTGFEYCNVTSTRREEDGFQDGAKERRPNGDCGVNDNQCFWTHSFLHLKLVCWNYQQCRDVYRLTVFSHRFRHPHHRLSLTSPSFHPSHRVTLGVTSIGFLWIQNVLQQHTSNHRLHRTCFGFGRWRLATL